LMEGCACLCVYTKTENTPPTINISCLFSFLGFVLKPSHDHMTEFASTEPLIIHHQWQTSLQK